MKPKISLIMSTYKRPHLLKWGLDSLLRQMPEISEYFSFELILLQDDYEPEIETVNIYRAFREELNIKYFHTGNSKGSDIRREQCFALNFGIKQATGDILILTSPEIYHVSANNILKIASPFLEKNKKILTTPKDPKDDLNGHYLKFLEENKTHSISLFQKAGSLSNLYNFFMGFWLENVTSIGAFDEDFTGWAYDDTDLIYRLLDSGHTYHEVDIDLIHLFHPRGTAKGPGYKEKIAFNKNLFETRRGIIQRNIGRDWGTLGENKNV